MPISKEPGETEFSTGRSNGRRAAKSATGRDAATVTPPAALDGSPYHGTIANDTMAEVVESQAQVLRRPPTTPLPAKRVRRLR